MIASVVGGGIPAGDAWVQANLSAYAAWAQANNSLLIGTFDENNTDPAVTYPDHVATIVVGAGVPAGVVNGSQADTYSLLATIESLYGAAPVGVSAGAPALNFYLSTPPTASASVTRSFSGLSDPTKNPPQNALAVGPNYVFTAETTHYEITDLSGNPIISNGSLYSLFSPLGGTLDNNLSGARAAYDSSTGRYAVIVNNFQPGGGNFATNIDVAVSVDSNPSDGWYLASIDTSNGNTTQSDRPYLSVSNGKIYISTPEFFDAGGGYNTGEFVVNESSVIAAGNGAITPDANHSVPGTGGIMRNVAGDNGVTYYLSAYSTARETALTYQTYDPTHGFSGTQTLYLGDADVGGGGSDYTAAQMGTTKGLDIGDGRIQSLAYASSGGHNYVFGVSEAMPSAGSLAEIEWFKLDVTDPTNPQFVIGNVISGASIGTGVAVFNPSIAVDQNGDVLINFSASGPNMYPSDYYTVLGAGASAFSAPALYQASNTYFDSGSLNDQRWGTYSTAVADPNNPNGFWISNEYVASGWWQTSVAQIAIQNATATGPTVASVAASGSGITNGTGDLNAGHVVTLTVNFSAAVTVNTTGGTPTLALNDGGTATYTGGSGSTALTFSYTVATGQNTSDLVISAFSLNSATVKDGAGNNANLSGATNYNPAGTLQIDTAAPTVSSIVTSGSGITNGIGDLNAGKVVTLTVTFSESVTVNTTGGSPTLTLNDGGSATYTGGSGSTALTFSYTVAAGQNTSDLLVSSLNLNGATVTDGAGNAANLSAATNYNPAGTLQIDTITPTISSIVTSGSGITNGGGDLGTGQVVTLTVNFSEPVAVNTTGGSPTLTLNDGGSATYTGGSGTTAMTFSYTIAAGQNTADLVVSAFNLGGATVRDGAGNNADPSGATNYNPSGTLQIDTIVPTVASIVTSGTGITNGSGTLGVGQVVTLTVTFSELVTVNTTGGSPALALNDGGTATYTGGSGSTALTFSYTVAAGQNTPDLIVSALNLNGATVKDGAGNNANLSGATNYNPAGTLQISTTTATAVSSIVSSGTGITNGTGDLNAGKAVTLTVNFSAAVTVDTTGGSPTLTLNDGGSAIYTGGSGSTALTFSYTVAAGQNTPDLVVSSFNLSGATVKDGAGNAADLSGATNYNPAGTLQVDTTPPIPSINQEPPSTTASTSALFAFGTSNIETTGTTYAYKLDGAASWTSLSGNSLSLSGLASGTHSIQVQATDAAGNLSTAPASYSWTISPTAPQITTQFAGPSVTTTYPPHNGLGVGPSNIVMVEGSRIEWTNLTGGSPVVQSTYNFFAALNPTGGLYDQRVVYDSINQRYVVIMDYQASGGTISDIDIAVSKDSNPNDGWYFASLNTSITINGQLTASDRPMLTVDGSNIYITAEQDNVNVSGSPGTETWVIGDTAGTGGGIYNGGTLTVVASQLLPSSQGVFTEITASNGKTYYASSYSNGSQIVVTLATFDKTTNTFSPTSIIGLGQIDQGGSYTAQQQGTSLLLDAGDKRVANLAYSNGFLWGVTEEMPPGSSVPLVHWFKIDVSNPSSPTLVAQGNISGAALGSNVATFNPSLAIDAAGDVLINFTASGPNLCPQDYYAYQLGSGPVGSFSAPILYQASTGFFNSGSTGVQRWGLYSTTIVDPNNPSSFWISNEYVANGWWQTAVAQVAIPVQPTAPTLTIANSSLNVPAGGSVGLGISVTPANPADNATVTISGLAAYETITDALDHITFSGNANTLSAAEVNSGLTLNSTYTGSGQPVNTLTVTAGVTTAAGTANSAAKTITVTDPPVTTIAAAPQLDRSLALLNQFAAAGFQDKGQGVLDSVTSTTFPFGNANAETLLSSPNLVSSPNHLV